MISVWSTETAASYGHVILRQEATPVDQAGDYDDNPDESNYDDSKEDPPQPPIQAWFSPPELRALSPSSSPASAPEPDHKSTIGPHREPTMFELCSELSPSFRLRWTLNYTENTIDLGLEAAADKSYYLALGWGPRAVSGNVTGAAFIVAGFSPEVL